MIQSLKEHYDSSPDEIIRAVQEAFPLKTSDKRKTSRRVSDVDLLRLILPNIRKLKDKKSLEKVLALVEKLLSESLSVVLDPNQIDLFDEQDSPN